MKVLASVYTVLIAYAIGWVAVFLVCRLLGTEKRGLVVKPFYLMYKTAIFNKPIERLAARKTFWRTFWNVGAAIGYGQIGLIIYQLTKNAFNLVYKTDQAGPIQLIIPLPGLTISWENFPYIIISIFVLVMTHEAAHGIAALVDGVPLKSAGVFFALAIPGGFVEPEEEKLEQASNPTKLRIFAAGSFTNIAVWLVVVILMMNFTTTISPFYNPSSSGVLITGLVEGGAAEKAQIPQWSVVTALNGTHVTNITDLSRYMLNVKPHSLVNIKTDGGTYAVLTQEHPQNKTRAVIGITLFNAYEPRFASMPVQLPYQVYMTENWMSIILISVALINMLPLYPLDGDKFLDTTLQALGIKRTKEVRTIASAVSLGILGANFALSFMTFGFMRI